MTLRPIHVALLIAAVAAGGALLWPDAARRAAPRGRAEATSAGASAAAPRRGGAGFDAQAAEREALALAFASRLERALEAPEELPLPLTSESRLEAEAAFEVVMGKLEELADSGARASAGRRRRLYRAANDAFSALSDHLDASSARDLAILEEAHSRMKQMLAEVGAAPRGR